MVCPNRLLPAGKALTVRMRLLMQKMETPLRPDAAPCDGMAGPNPDVAPCNRGLPRPSGRAS